MLRCGGHPVNLAVEEAYDTALSVPFKVGGGWGRQGCVETVGCSTSRAIHFAKQLHMCLSIIINHSRPPGAHLAQQVTKLAP